MIETIRYKRIAGLNTFYLPIVLSFLYFKLAEVLLYSTCAF